jgi:hypothetical protein
MGFVHVRVRGHFGHLGVTPFNMSCKFLSMIMKIIIIIVIVIIYNIGISKVSFECFLRYYAKLGSSINHLSFQEEALCFDRFDS